MPVSSPKPCIPDAAEDAEAAIAAPRGSVNGLLWASDVPIVDAAADDVATGAAIDEEAAVVAAATAAAAASRLARAADGAETVRTAGEAGVGMRTNRKLESTVAVAGADMLTISKWWSSSSNAVGSGAARSSSIGDTDASGGGESSSMGTMRTGVVRRLRRWSLLPVLLPRYAVAGSAVSRIIIIESAAAAGCMSGSDRRGGGGGGGGGGPAA
ncbi:hypothetical protein BC828DRAFT_386161 [Blastocladiella britannica]|nr:hypothetical protein BC828DRAFT_386161 [Blastocladiella britannica]